VERGLTDKPAPYLFNLYVEPLRRFQLAAEGHGATASRPTSARPHPRRRSTRCPSGIQPFEDNPRSTPNSPSTR
jgi:sulfite dehydrogenase (quinone) subunit SoeA